MDWPVTAKRVVSSLVPACLLLLSTGVLPGAQAAGAAITEEIFVCLLYSPPVITQVEAEKVLAKMGAVRDKRDRSTWRYANLALGREFLVRFPGTIDAMRAALYTPGAHVIISGHANFGLGGVYANRKETNKQAIRGISYIDDARIFTYSSPWIAVRISGMVQDQAYPDWWPIFKDGTSGIMPYDFGDPRGDPPYNYYLTYQLPGDPTFYRVETVNNSALERFPDADIPAWFAADGSLPDPGNPEHVQYYITNPDESFQFAGKWQTIGSAHDASPPYYGSNYLSAPAGSGDRTATWYFTIPQAGVYNVSAYWLAAKPNTAAVTFTVNSAAGSTPVKISQKSKKNDWHKLGSFTFQAGRYSVVLTNKATAGNVVADAVRITHATNALVFDTIVDNTTCPKQHFRRKTILFRKELELEPDKLQYSRLFYETCNGGLYYIDTFHRGIMFYTVDDSAGTGVLPYLKAYLQGKSDQEIWTVLQHLQPVYDFYDFSRPPPAESLASALTLMAPAGISGLEPARVTANTGVDFETAIGIRRLALLPVHEAFARLQDAEFLADEALLCKATLSAFRFRRSEAIALALRYVTSPVMQARDGGMARRENDWTVAKAIIEVFADEAVPPLLALYRRTDAGTRGNIIRLLGNMDGGEIIDGLLLSALEDKTFCEEETAESVGEPLRLCDVAYNQLIQRYGWTDLLRTLGQVHRIEIRNYHIDVLKSRLGLL